MLMNSVQNHTTSVQFAQANSDWKERLDTLITYPRFESVNNFLVKTVRPALDDLKNEMQARGLKVNLNLENEQSVSLVVDNDGVEDFKYEVYLREYEAPEFTNEKNEKFCRAEVFLLSGGQDYDVFGYSEEQIVADAITQYEKHIHYLHKSNNEIS